MNQYRPETFKAANRVRPKREPVEALPSWITPRFAKRSAACACLVAGPHWRCVWLPPSKPLPSIITRRVREIAVEAAKLEQLRLEREHCGAIARIEKVIDSGFGVGGACSGPFSPIKDPVGAYLHEAAAAPLLSREEEVAIAKRIEAGGEDGQRAKDEMARANLRLVVSVAKKYTDNRGARFLDMIQEGNFGLTKAIDKFEWGRGYKFSTMATLWIGDAITRPLKKVEEKLKTISWENLDDFAASPAEGWPGVPQRKRASPSTTIQIRTIRVLLTARRIRAVRSSRPESGLQKHRRHQYSRAAVLGSVFRCMTVIGAPLITWSQTRRRIFARKRPTALTMTRRRAWKSFEFWARSDPP